MAAPFREVFMPPLRPPRQIRLAALRASAPPSSHSLDGVGETMSDLIFVILGAALFFGALVYARACANL
jgi:hypothetical protein